MRWLIWRGVRCSGARCRMWVGNDLRLGFSSLRPRWWLGTSPISTPAPTQLASGRGVLSPNPLCRTGSSRDGVRRIRLCRRGLSRDRLRRILLCRRGLSRHGVRRIRLCRKASSRGGLRRWALDRLTLTWPVCCLLSRSGLRRPTVGRWLLRCVSRWAGRCLRLNWPVGLPSSRSTSPTYSALIWPGWRHWLLWGQPARWSVPNGRRLAGHRR
jgi:hypothetical protein